MPRGRAPTTPTSRLTATWTSLSNAVSASTGMRRPRALIHPARPTRESGGVEAPAGCSCTRWGRFRVGPLSEMGGREVKPAAGLRAGGLRGVYFREGGVGWERGGNSIVDCWWAGLGKRGVGVGCARWWGRGPVADDRGRSFSTRAANGRRRKFEDERGRAARGRADHVAGPAGGVDALFPRASWERLARRRGAGGVAVLSAGWPERGNAWRRRQPFPWAVV
jgi:hypothetical protein